MKNQADDEIKGHVMKALRNALRRRKLTVEKAATLLQVEVGTMYKYINGDIIPGGQVLWLACKHLGMVLDEVGFHVAERTPRNKRQALGESGQYDLPFINESVSGKKVVLHVKKKDSQYVQVRLRIKV